MTTPMYLLYAGFDYTDIDIKALAQGIKSILASQVWFQAVAGAQTYDTDSPAITSQPRYPFDHRDIPYVLHYHDNVHYEKTNIQERADDLQPYTINNNMADRYNTPNKSHIYFLINAHKYKQWRLPETPCMY